MAEYKEPEPCCHCVNIENSNIEKFFKARCITDECVKEDGKKYFKIQWEETWAREEDLKNCNDLLEHYTKNGKPQVEVLSQTENQNGESVLFVKVTGSPSNNENNFPIQGMDSQALLEKALNMSELAPKSAMASEMEDVKMVTYAQLQKAGFLVDEDDATEANNAPVNVDNLESAKQKMYSQIGTSLENMKFIHYVHNDLESSRARRNYSIRRRQPFQLYKCDVCGSEFVHRTHLKIHQRTHTGEKPYKCQYCGRCFAQKGNLHVHIKIHTGEKDFICEYCQRGFITNAQLFVHMRTHTNPNRKRPYPTGRPPKGMQPEKKVKVSEESPNQIIVQLVEADGEGQSNSSTPQKDIKNDISSETCRVENSEEKCENDLKSVSIQDETPVFNMPDVPETPTLHNLVVPEANFRDLAKNGADMMHILVTQQ